MGIHVQGLDYVVLVVEDLDRSLAFYRDRLGLSLRHRAEQFAQLETGRTRFGLFTRAAMAGTLHCDLRRPAPDQAAFELGFRVADVDAAWDELTAAGAPGVTPPETRPWGQRTAYLRDPDGNLVELATQLERPDR